MATVQFDHRLIAWLLAILVPRALVEAAADGEACRARAQRRDAAARRSLALQIALGISTLLLVVPLPLAAAHQAGAVLVFAAALNVAHALR